MEFHVLGPLQAEEEGAPVPLGGPQQRAMLGVLLIDAGKVVSTDRLIDELWGESPPETARKSVQVYASRLRQAVNLGAERLRGVAPGYRLDLHDAALDAARFEQGVARARAALADDPGAARDLLAAALAMWQGPPFGELGDETPSLRLEAARLEELRLVAWELRLDADLTLGDHAAAVPDAERLVAQHPLRERFCGQLMTALSRSGRQAEALRAFQELRTRLGEELGIEPSADLRLLEERILLQADAAPAPAGRLPQRVSNFVGRAAEMRGLAEVIAHHRLVTVTGMGGVGKTSVALEVARSLASGFRDGAWLVDLSAPQPDQPLDLEVAVSLDVPVEPDGDPIDATIRHLRERQLLLLADNCDRVADRVAPLLEQLLTSCPGVRVLATCRGPLHVSGEAQFQLSPMEAPDAEAAPGAILASDAVLLLRDRAALVGRAAEVTAATARAAALLCQRLNGVPLAIEIAAARLKTMPLATVAQQLDDRVTMLGSRGAATAQRHRTLRAALDWSYELLAPPARLLLPRLSVFDDPFKLRGVTEVCPDRRLRKGSIPDAFEQLVGASLVQVTPRAEPTFHLLDVVRDYAAVLLGDRDKALRRRYAKYVVVKRDQDFREFLQRRIHETQIYLEAHGSRWQPSPWRKTPPRPWRR